ncbi:hypothetical protein D1114_11710 [Cereibacter sphaeroides]|uniref:Uncharacterized protein n=1 Tax=Cereibacter sphaeroides TaxID=1063 RepID=A0AAX1UKA1_CERSP|nr:hypothetical protein D1114_11710 [Cereibacter sphaeroides]
MGAVPQARIRQRAARRGRGLSVPAHTRPEEAGDGGLPHSGQRFRPACAEAAAVLGHQARSFPFRPACAEELGCGLLHSSTRGGGGLGLQEELDRDIGSLEGWNAL